MNENEIDNETFKMQFLCVNCKNKLHLSTRGHGKEQKIFCPKCGEQIGSNNAKEIRIFG